jgi:hypothetical protein
MNITVQNHIKKREQVLFLLCTVCCLEPELFTENPFSSYHDMHWRGLFREPFDYNKPPVANIYGYDYIEIIEKMILYLKDRYKRYGRKCDTNGNLIEPPPKERTLPIPTGHCKECGKPTFYEPRDAVVLHVRKPINSRDNCYNCVERIGR